MKIIPGKSSAQLGKVGFLGYQLYLLEQFMCVSAYILI